MPTSFHAPWTHGHGFQGPSPQVQPPAWLGLSRVGLGPGNRARAPRGTTGSPPGCPARELRAAALSKHPPPDGLCSKEQAAVVQGHCQGALVRTALASIQPPPHRWGHVAEPSWAPAVCPWPALPPQSARGSHAPQGPWRSTQVILLMPNAPQVAEIHGHAPSTAPHPQGPPLLPNTPCLCPKQMVLTDHLVVPPRDKTLCHKGPLSWIMEPQLARAEAHTRHMSPPSFATAGTDSPLGTRRWFDPAASPGLQAAPVAPEASVGPGPGPM